MEIRKVPISLLNAAPYNPRKDLQPGDPEYQKIARSIEKYGCVEPIIWNEKTGNVIGGHQRLKVLAATGAVEVDVSVVQLSLEDEKALNLALNKISGQWDNEKLSAVLQDLSVGFDVEVTGFDQHEVDALVASFAESGLGWVHTHEGRMQLIGIIIGQYLLKACLALLDTPFFYFFTRNADRR